MASEKFRSGQIKQMKTEKEYIKPGNCKAGKMYGMMKTYKVDNQARVTTSDCNTAIANLSILVQKTLYPIADKLTSKI